MGRPIILNNLPKTPENRGVFAPKKRDSLPGPLNGALYTVDEIASIFGVSPKTIHNLAACGKLRKTRIPAGRISVEALADFWRRENGADLVVNGK